MIRIQFITNKATFRKKNMSPTTFNHLAWEGMLAKTLATPPVAIVIVNHVHRKQAIRSLMPTLLIFFALSTRSLRLA